MLHGKRGHEFVVILTTRGCQHYYSDDLGCTMCGYNNDSAGETVPGDIIAGQFSAALAKHEKEIAGAGNVVAKVFNSGSFFDEKEIPAGVQEQVLASLASLPTVQEVAVESRPEFISQESLCRFKAKLREDQLGEVGIGLETWNDEIRLDFINKGFTRDQFMHVHEILKEHNVGTKVYLLLKPLFLDELAALIDARESMKHLLSLGVSTISINPAAIHANTVMERFWERGKYRPPWLWTAMLLLHEAFTLPARDMNTLVLCDPVAGGKPRGAHNCRDMACNQRALAIIKDAIEQQATVGGLDPRPVAGGAACACHLEWLDEMHF